MSMLFRKSGEPHNQTLSFEDLVTKHMPQLWQLASTLCKYNAQDAEDLIQDSMLRAFRGRVALMEASNQLAWLKKVVVNTYLNTVRDSRKHTQSRELLETDSITDSLEGVPSSIIESLKTDLWNDDILMALSALPEDARTLFLLSDVEGYTHEELSEMYGLPKGTVSSRIFRARRKLVTLLEQYATEHGYVEKQAVESEREEMRKGMDLCAERSRLETEAYEQLCLITDKVGVQP